METASPLRPLLASLEAGAGAVPRRSLAEGRGDRLDALLRWLKAQAPHLALVSDLLAPLIERLTLEEQRACVAALVDLLDPGRIGSDVSTSLPALRTLLRPFLQRSLISTAAMRKALTEVARREANEGFLAAY